MSAYYTLVLPWAPAAVRSPWHPTERTGPFSTLTRGAFATRREALQWAKRNLGRAPFTIRALEGGARDPGYTKREFDAETKENWGRSRLDYERETGMHEPGAPHPRGWGQSASQYRRERRLVIPRGENVDKLASISPQHRAHLRKAKRRLAGAGWYLLVSTRGTRTPVGSMGPYDSEAEAKEARRRIVGPLREARKTVSQPVRRTAAGAYVARDPAPRRGKNPDAVGVNREGMTWLEWHNAAGTPRDMREAREWKLAWQRGEDPTEYRASRDPSKTTRARLGRREPRAKFRIGDHVKIDGTDLHGRVSFVGSYDEHLGDRRYKVEDQHGGRKNWNGRGLTKVRRDPDDSRSIALRGTGPGVVPHGRSSKPSAIRVERGVTNQVAWHGKSPNFSPVTIVWNGPGSRLYLLWEKQMVPVQHPLANGSYSSFESADRAARAFIRGGR